ESKDRVCLATNPMVWAYCRCLDYRQLCLDYRQIARGNRQWFTHRFDPAQTELFPIVDWITTAAPQTAIGKHSPMRAPNGRLIVLATTATQCRNSLLHGRGSVSGSACS